MAIQRYLRTTWHCRSTWLGNLAVSHVSSQRGWHPHLSQVAVVCVLFFFFLLFCHFLIYVNLCLDLASSLAVLQLVEASESPRDNVTKDFKALLICVKPAVNWDPTCWEGELDHSNEIRTSKTAR